MQIGLIFDWDGVIIDSAAAHELSWEILAKEEHLPLPDNHFSRSFGRRNNEIIPNILEWSSDLEEIARLSNRKESIYRDQLVQGNARVLEGVVPFLTWLRANEIPCAVGSSTARANIEAGMKLGALNTYFQAISCAEDVERGKPEPDVFLNAATKLKIPPDKCIVFEDAPFGIEAALRANMIAVGIRSKSHSQNALEKAHYVLDRLDEWVHGDLGEKINSIKK